MKIMLTFLIFLSFSLGLVFDIPVENIDYHIEKEQGYDRIFVKSGSPIDEPGAPEMPTITYNYSLPPNQTIKELSIIEEKWVEIPGHFNIYPKQKSVSIEDNRVFTPPNPVIYNSESPFPYSVIINHLSGNLRGYRIAQFSVAPFRYSPRGGKLWILKKLKVEVRITSCETGISPKRQSRLSKTTFENFVSAIVLNKSQAPPSYTEENPEDLTPTELPSLFGPPVDLLIITTDPQIPGYEKFAQSKRLSGFNTVVKTLSWIRQHYNGIDDAERVRNFVREAVQYWGVSYVLLGGDVPEIPTRWIWMVPLLNSWPVHITTDLYFSDLDGSWDCDGDRKFGEMEDSIDFYPDVFVGRITSTNSYMVLDYLDKLRSYLFPTNFTHQIKTLFVSSQFHVPLDAYFMAVRLSGHIPLYLNKSFIDEAGLRAFRDSIYAGYGLITVLAHGDVNLVRVRTFPSREYAVNHFFDSLTNNTYPLMVVITCYSNPFELDCLGEHWVMNPSGGGVGYIGPTSSSSAYDHEWYVASLFDYLFALPLAGSLAFSKIPYIPGSQTDNWRRMLQFSITLLGDPTLNLWDSIPKQFNSVVINPRTIQVGFDTLSILINPAVPCTLLCYKENETFIEDTSIGLAPITIKTKSPGYLKVAVFASNYITYIDSVYVKSAAPYLTLGNLRVVDSLQNSNGIVNPGEDIFLYITLKNNGSAPATGVFARIASADSFITIIRDTASYPDIYPGTPQANLLPFYFKVSNSIYDAHPIKFSLLLNYSGNVDTDSFQFIAHAPRLQLFTQRFRITGGDTIRILPFLWNQGHASADSVFARISAYPDTILVLDSTVSFPVIAVNSVSSSLADSFKAYLNLPGALAFNIRVYYRNCEIINQDVILNSVAGIDSVWAFGMKNSIALEWFPVTHVIGYRIYRSVSPNGPYQFLKNHFIPITYFEDFNVQGGSSYFYYLTAVDSSYNESSSSDTICGRTNPAIANGWPAAVYGWTFSSANFGDIDPFYPGLEIVVGGRDGTIYAWHYDGTPVLPGSNGKLFETIGEIYSSPAIGDVDGDSALEIVFGVRGKWSDNFYCINNQGIPLNNWPRTVNSDIISSPVLADIDEDGDLEIFAWTTSAYLYAFHHTGAGVYSSDGVLKILYGSAVGTPAIGDINDDGDLEIICCGGNNSDSLFVWDRYGNYLPPFPIQIMSKMPFSVVVGDIIGDRNLEIAFYTDSSDVVHLIDATGHVLWEHCFLLGDIEASPIIADLTGDGRPEVICGNNLELVAYDSLGNVIPGFPASAEQNYKMPILADVEGDNSMDIVVGSSNWRLFALRKDASIAAGFPIMLDNGVDCSPAVCDIDLDGRLELMVGDNGYRFFVFDLNSNLSEWPKFRYDQHNTGKYKSGIGLGIIIARDKGKTTNFRLTVYPSPFSRVTHIKFQIPNSKSQIQKFNLKIYDASGRLVRQWDDQTIRLSDKFVWQGDDDMGRTVPAGVYFVRLEDSDKNLTQKVVKIE